MTRGRSILRFFSSEYATTIRAWTRDGADGFATVNSVRSTRPVSGSIQSVPFEYRTSPFPPLTSVGPACSLKRRAQVWIPSILVEPARAKANREISLLRKTFNANVGRFISLVMSPTLYRVLSAFMLSRRFVLASGELSKASSKGGATSLTFTPSTRFTFRTAAHCDPTWMISKSDETRRRDLFTTVG